MSEQMYLHAAIVANGEIKPSWYVNGVWELEGTLRIAANGGARNARLHLQIAPHIVIGDLDSLDEETRVWLESSHTEFIQYPPEKDKTDLEIALDLAQARGVGDINVLGFNGGRADQFVSNIMLLSRFVNMNLIDDRSEMWIATTGSYIKGTAGDLISLVPIDERVDGIITDGLKYPLQNETLERGSTRGISNVMLQKHVTIEWKQGRMLIVHLF